MIIRLFLLGVLLASGYLLFSQSEQLRSLLTETLTLLERPVHSEEVKSVWPDSIEKRQLNQLKQEIEDIKRQLTDLQTSELRPSAPSEQTVVSDNWDSLPQISPPDPEVVEIVEGADKTVNTRQQLMGLAERMELRALQYGR